MQYKTLKIQDERKKKKPKKEHYNKGKNDFFSSTEREQAAHHKCGPNCSLLFYVFFFQLSPISLIYNVFYAIIYLSSIKKEEDMKERYPKDRMGERCFYAFLFIAGTYFVVQTAIKGASEVKLVGIIGFSLIIVVAIVGFILSYRREK